MKVTVKIKKWQLLRYKSREAVADLSSEDFIAVGKRAFRRQKRLETVIFPPMLSAIKTEAFRGCVQLGKITLPAQNNVGLSAAAFAKCTALREVENSQLLSMVGMRAFARCVGLGEMRFGREMRKLGDEAFRGCTSLAELTLPSCLEVIGKAAFADCTALTCVEMEDALDLLAPDLFRNCTSLTDLRFSSRLHEIPSNAFRNCRALTALAVPANVQKIGRRAFYGCSQIETVTLENGVTSIGAGAFAKQPKLQEVAVPHTLKHLGFGAFGLGSAKEKVVLNVENEYMCRRLRRLLFLCGSSRRVQVTLVGKSIEERKRERRRSTVEQKPVHLLDRDDTDGETK